MSNQNAPRVDQVVIDEFDRIGVDELMPILALKHRQSVFRFIRENADFPPPKKFGQRLSWARGAVLRWILMQPDRTSGDPVIAERLVKSRKTARRYYPRRSKASQPTA